MAKTVNLDPLTQPSLSPESEKARLLISPSPVQAFEGSISLAKPGEGVLRFSAAGVVGGEREYADGEGRAGRDGLVD